MYGVHGGLGKVLVSVASVGGVTGSLDKDQQDMLCPLVYIGKNPSGPETSHLSLLTVIHANQRDREKEGVAQISHNCIRLSAGTILLPAKPEFLMCQLLKSQDAQKGRQVKEST